MTNTEKVKIATALCKSGNPYKKISIKFYVDKSPRYLFHEKIYTEEEINNAYIKHAISDIERGYKDRKAGYYDKYYRCTMADEGAAYDAGAQEALKNADCSKEFYLIECVY